MKFTGAKRGAGVLQWLINQMPPHDVFIDAFLGTGAVSMGKFPAACSIGIDADDQAPGLAALATLGSKFHVINADARGVLESLVTDPRGGNAVDLRRLSAFLPSLDLAASTIGAHAVDTVGNGECTVDGRKILIYLDPPYLGETRTIATRRYYRHELLSWDEHLELLTLAKRLPCMVMISGYWSPLYERELTGWRTSTFQTMTRGGKATEWLWMNFPQPSRLHDLRFIGSNHQERLDFKRLKERWKCRFEKMPPVKRQAIQQALMEVVGG